MIYKVVVDNFLGESTTCELANPYGHGLNITDISGIGPESISVVTQDLALLDGSVYSSSRAPERDITISFRYLGVESDDVERTRHRMYRAFGGLGRQVRLHFHTGDNVLFIDGYVKDISADIFSADETASVAIVCPDPWFRSETVLKTVLFDHINEQDGFEFVTDYGYEIQNRYEFGSYDTRYAYRDSVDFDVYNPGDRDIGCVIRAMSLSEDPIDLFHISFTNETTGEFSQANLSTLEGQVLRFNQYDIYEMNSIPGYKMINFYKYARNQTVKAAMDEKYDTMPGDPRGTDVANFYTNPWYEQIASLDAYRRLYAKWFDEFTDIAYPMDSTVEADTYNIIPHLNLYDRHYKWFKLRKGWNTIGVMLRSGHWGDSGNELPHFEVTIEYEPMYEGV